MRSVQLNNGVAMPAIGLGTSDIERLGSHTQYVTDTIAYALQCGYKRNGNIPKNCKKTIDSTIQAVL